MVFRAGTSQNKTVTDPHQLFELVELALIGKIGFVLENLGAWIAERVVRSVVAAH